MKCGQFYRGKGSVLRERDPGYRAAGVPEVKGWQEVLGTIRFKALESTPV